MSIIEDILICFIELVVSMEVFKGYEMDDEGVVCRWIYMMGRFVCFLWYTGDHYDDDLEKE